MAEVRIFTPAPRSPRRGNRVTALRWAGLLRAADRRVRVVGTIGDLGAPDLFVVLHAVHGAEAAAAFTGRFPDRPLVVVLTGTDVYPELTADPAARAALERAHRIVALQEHCIGQLPAAWHAKTRVVHQSAAPPPGPPPPRHKDRFEVCALGHLREVKAPFVAAEAVRFLPADSRVQVLHVGAALDASHADRARAESAAGPRWQWLGPRPRAKALDVLRRSRLLLLTSRAEGSPSAVSEALACGIPVLTTPIPGALALLGADWPATFPIDDPRALADALRRCETDPTHMAALGDAVRRRAGLVAPARERAALEALVTECLG